MNFPLDKRAHFLGGWAIAATAYSLTGALIDAFALVLIAGVAKEIYDYLFDGTPEWQDIAATCAGWVPLALLVYATQAASMRFFYA
jgi:hypothetical protein